ncbi:unnamed protein product [Sphagnum troendelagicum]|uniref:Uncharacterized protein n=1 Tax=Sphagnum troendelagicum TaxID=128251 RepID=A0ABP0TMX3_9BRYO
MTRNWIFSSIYAHDACSSTLRKKRMSAVEIHCNTACGAKKVLADYNTSSLLGRTRKQSDQKENRVDDAPQSIHGLRLHRICTESLTAVVMIGAIIGEMITKQKHAQTATPLAAADDDDRCCCHYFDLHTLRWNKIYKTAACIWKASVDDR